MDVCSDGPIGLLDSGLGGLTVLQSARELLPAEDFVFYGDLAHSPYGGRSKEEVVSIIEKSVSELQVRRIKALVLASNTGTSAAAEHLRERLEIPVVGMEPALKPAVRAVGKGKILVLATELTLRERKFEALWRQYRHEAPIILKSCPGLVELIDHGVHSGPKLDAFLADLLREARAEPVSVVVLGCTHYIIVREAILQVFSPKPLCLDGNDGVARQLCNVLDQRGLLRAAGTRGTVQIISSDPTRLGLLEETFQRLDTVRGGRPIPRKPRQ
jgi:glutamate racemase